MVRKYKADLPRISTSMHDTYVMCGRFRCCSCINIAVNSSSEFVEVSSLLYCLHNMEPTEPDDYRIQ